MGWLGWKPYVDRVLFGLTLLEPRAIVECVMLVHLCWIPARWYRFSEYFFYIGLIVELPSVMKLFSWNPETVLALKYHGPGFSTSMVGPIIFSQYICTVFNTNRHTFEKSAKEIHKRKISKKSSLSHYRFLLGKINRNENRFVTEIYTGKCSHLFFIRKSRWIPRNISM